MKKILFYAIIPTFLLLSTRLYAQPDWQWGKSLGNTIQDIAVDNHGNTYALWILLGTQAVEGHIFTSQGGTDIGLTSFSCDGTYRWTKIIGGPSYDASFAVGVDTLGGVYIAISVAAFNSDTIDVSGDTLITPTNKRYYLVKYNSMGVYQWLRAVRAGIITDPEYAGALEMMVSPEGTLYLPSILEPGIYGDGAYVNTAQFDLVTFSGSAIHSLKYDRFGNCLGGIHFDLYHSGTIPRGYARDTNTGRYYLCGFITNYMPYDTLIFGETAIYGSEEAFTGYIAAYDSSGNFLWVNQSEPGAGSLFRYKGTPCLDAVGNIYCAGDSRNGFNVGEFTLINNLGTSSFPILVKLNPEGEVINATNASTTSASYGEDVAYANNTIGVAGHYPTKLEWGEVNLDNSEADTWYSVFLARFNTNDITSPFSIDTLSGSANSYNEAKNLTSDSEGNFYLTGEFPGSLYIGPDIIYSQSQEDGFIAKFGTDSCLCTPPMALFSYDSLPADYTFAFNYTGTSPIDSLIWDFGDGQTGGEPNTTHTFIPDSTYTVCVTAYNPCGVHTFCDTVLVEIMVGIDPINNFEGVTVYPNPAKDKINIAHAPPGTVVNIYTILGTRVLQKRMTGGKNQIDVSGLTPGLYLMRFTDEKGKRGFTRFVKG